MTPVIHRVISAMNLCGDLRERESVCVFVCLCLGLYKYEGKRKLVMEALIKERLKMTSLIQKKELCTKQNRRF